MKAPGRKPSSRKRPVAAQPRSGLRWGILACALVLILGLGLWERPPGDHRPPKGSPQSSRSPITFNQDIAPILYDKCANCHRAGQSGPFPLVTYADAKKRAKEIEEVTSHRTMPPWPPDPGFVTFQQERRLTDEQVNLIRQWRSEGAIEGAESERTRTPQWVEGWELGQPDLVLRMSETYTLPAEGRDVYRAFVIPVPLEVKRYVKAMEFHPSNRCVHHASMRLDASPESRLMDLKDEGPGFGGMDLPSSAMTPDGHFLSWQPGRLSYTSPPGLPWSIGAGMDFVVQLHMQPTGKSESVRLEVGLYFTDERPTNQLAKLVLKSSTIDIPPGQSDYVVEDSYVTPVDLYAIGVNPHAHYLGKDLQAYAELPDGTKRWLLRISHWDFKWQGNYSYDQPVFLPRASRLVMRYTYDNSEANPNNPHRPPQRVRYGVQTTDEMAEFWLQVLTSTKEEMAKLMEDYRAKEFTGIMAYYQHRIDLDSRDAKAHSLLGSALLGAGRKAEAIQHFRTAIECDSHYSDPHYFLGLIHRNQNNLNAAREEFEAAIRLNPTHYKAYGNLGFMAAAAGHLREAEDYLTKALAIHPHDELSQKVLQEIRAARAR